MSDRMKGTVQSFTNEEGFGWIEGDDGVRYFVRFWDIQMDGYKTLRASQRVDFEVDPHAIGDDESPVAVEVQVLGDIPEPWPTRPSTLRSMANPLGLDQQLASRLAARFAQRVMDAAALPHAREADLCESCELQQHTRVLRLTCTITGSSYERAWDGSEAEALTLVDEAADSTAGLIARTPHYAWMRSRR